MADPRVVQLVRRTAWLGTAALAGALLGRAVEMVWRSAVDPLGADGLTLPEGKTRTVTTDDGAELAVTVCAAQAGAGPRGVLDRRRAPTVVLAHCYSGSRRVWAPVARQLVAAGNRVVLYDQRGHGESTLGREAPTVARLGADLATVLRQLRIRDAVLAGHSMGGFTVMALACNHPDELRDRVRGLVLVSTAAHGVGLGGLDPLAARLLGSGVASWAVRRPRLGLFLVRSTLGRRPCLPALEAAREMFLDTAPDVRAACFTGFGGMDHREKLAKVDVPTVVIVGSRDTLTPPRLARAIVDAMPDARLEQIEGAGHMLPLEAPERLAAAIRSVQI